MSAPIDVPAIFELHYPGDAELVPVVRRFLFDLCNKAVPKAPEVASHVALAAFELLDNAVRYGPRRDAVLRFEIVALEPAAQVRISVSNTLTLGQLQTLSTEVEKIRLATDPEAHFRELMRQQGSGRVGLGLARIRAEAGLDIHLGVNGSRATVFAQSPELLGGLAAPRPPTRPGASPELVRPSSHGALESARPSSQGTLEPARPSTYGTLTPVRPTTPSPADSARPPTQSSGLAAVRPRVEPGGPGPQSSPTPASLPTPPKK